MVFIVIRYTRDGALELIEDEDEDGESVTATWPNVASASEWAQGNSLIQSGQVSYKIYDIPSGDLRCQGCDAVDNCDYHGLCKKCYDQLSEDWQL